MTAPMDVNKKLDTRIAMLTVKLYADDQLIFETDDEITWVAAMNRIMNLREPRG